LPRVGCSEPKTAGGRFYDHEIECFERWSRRGAMKSNSME
jgi:hypothetical protein